jgi:hypothetical protein
MDLQARPEQEDMEEFRIWIARNVLPIAMQRNRTLKVTSNYNLDHLAQLLVPHTYLERIIDVRLVIVNARTSDILVLQSKVIRLAEALGFSLGEQRPSRLRFDMCAVHVLRMVEVSFVNWRAGLEDTMRGADFLHGYICAPKGWLPRFEEDPMFCVANTSILP